VTASQAMLKQADELVAKGEVAQVSNACSAAL
jgi:hypothetical protein